MAFPSVRSVAITNGTTASTTPTINLPATVSAGDTIFVVFRLAVTSVIGWPDANWNELFDFSPDASDDQFAAAWKKADGTEGGTTIQLSTLSGKYAAIAYAIQDAADPTVTPPELSTVATGSATEPNATTCTPTGGAKDYLWLTFFGMEGEQTGITSYPTNYTLGQSGLANSGTGGAVTTNVTVAGAARQANAASEDAGVWDVTGTLDDWAAYTIAFHPAPPTPEFLIRSSNSSHPTNFFPRLTPTIGIIGIAVNLLQSTLAPIPEPPHKQTDWPNPAPTRAQLVVNINSRPVEDANIAFTPIDWRNPDRLKQQTLTWTNDGNREVVTQNPFVLPSFENPRRVKFGGYDWIFTKQEEVAVEPPVKPTDWKVYQKKREGLNYNYKILPILETAGLVPNKQTDWRVYPRKQQTLNYSYNLLESTLAPVFENPHRQTEWPNPLQSGQILVTQVSTPEKPDVGEPFTPIIYPNPLKKGIATDLKTHTSHILPLYSEVPPPFTTSENPVLRYYPITNRTWTQSQVLTRIVGDPFTPVEWRNPQVKKVPVRDWIIPREILAVEPVGFACAITLGIGAPGDLTCFTLVGLDVNPQPFLQGSNLFLPPRKRQTITHIQNRPPFYSDVVPFKNPVVSNPLTRKPQTVSWVASRLLTISEPVDIPLTTSYFDNPPVGLRGLIVSISTRFPAPAVVQAPHRQRDWPNPVLRRKVGQDWRDFYLVDENEPTQSQNIYFNNPLIKKVHALSWIQNPLVASPITTIPIGKREFNLPVLKRVLAHTWITDSLAVSDIPFKQIEWFNPELEKIVPTWVQNRPFYYQEIQPVVLNLFPNPIILKRNDVSYIFTQQIQEEVPTRNFEWLNPILLPQQTKLWIVNLLQSTLEPAPGETPFSFTNYDNPAARFKTIGTQGWIQETKKYYLDILPFRQTDWPLFLAPERHVRDWIEFLIKEPETPIVPNIFRNPRLQIERAKFWTTNQLETTLTPAPPNAQREWPNPIRGKINRVDFIDTVTRLIEGNAPFRFTDWPISIKRVITHTHTENPIIILTAEAGATPFAEYDWKVTRRVRRADILTIVGQNFIILPNIQGRTICLLANADIYQLEAALELFDLEGRIEIYDLDAGGSDCE